MDEGLAYSPLRETPYTPDEQRVCDFLRERAPAIGCGNDPIGFLMASYAYAVEERNEARARLVKVERETLERAAEVAERNHDKNWQRYGSNGDYSDVAGEDIAAAIRALKLED